MRRIIGIAVGVLLAGLLASCSVLPAAAPDGVAVSASAGPAAPPPTSPAPTPNEPLAALVATAARPSVDVYDAPGGSVVATLSNPQPSGAPLTFLVLQIQGEWLQVSVPVRPNGSTGWILAVDEMLTRVDYRLEVSTEANTLSVYKNDELLQTYSVATGTGGTPTPHGSFYLTELLAPTNAGYGPYAFGISAFSEVLTSFGGGPGQIGLHGTDDTDSIGQSASHGCVRMTNEDITTLAQLLPLGTPITIS